MFEFPAHRVHYKVSCYICEISVLLCCVYSDWSDWQAHPVCAVCLFCEQQEETMDKIYTHMQVAINSPTQYYDALLI